MGFQLLADFALLMAQNASFGNEVKGHPEISHFTYSSLLNGADGLEMYDYTRNDSNIRVYIDFERDREGDELIHFFALKSVQNATFDNEVFCLVGKSESCHFRRVIRESTSNKFVLDVYLWFESIGTYMDL